jgi:hypothetical protein
VDRDSLAKGILSLMQAGLFEEIEDEEPPPAKLTGNDYIALAITKVQLKSDIQKITSNLTSQDLKSYFGEAAAKKHELWTVSGKGAESKYALTNAGRERVDVLLKDEALRSKLEAASAGVVGVRVCSVLEPTLPAEPDLQSSLTCRSDLACVRPPSRGTTTAMKTTTTTTTTDRRTTRGEAKRRNGAPRSWPLRKRVWTRHARAWQPP